MPALPGLRLHCLQLRFADLPDPGVVEFFQRLIARMMRVAIGIIACCVVTADQRSPGMVTEILVGTMQQIGMEENG